MAPQKRPAILSAIVYTLFMCCFGVWQDGFPHGIYFGLLAGALCGFLMYWFTKKIKVNKYMLVDIPDKGNAIFSDVANHFKGWEGVGGHLFLFEDKLWFKSHRFNIQRHELQIPLYQISDVIPYNVLGIFPTGLKIITNNGATEKFVVNNREDWQSAILAAKAVSA